MKEIEEAIVKFFLDHHNEPMCIRDIKAQCPELRDLRIQKVSYILSKMVYDGILEKVTITVKEGGFWNRRYTYLIAFHLA